MDNLAKQAFPEDTRIAELADAAAKGDSERVGELVRQGANPNAHGDKDVTPLQFALLSQNEAGMRALINQGADPNLHGIGGDTAIHLAAITDDSKYLKLLLELGGNPNARNAETQAVPLAGAAGPRTDAQFRMLLDAGADVNLTDRTGNTPLHIAGMINAGEHVLILLEKGTNPLARNAQDATFQPYFFRTPNDRLHYEAKSNRRKVIEWLKEHNIPLEASVPEELTH